MERHSISSFDSGADKYWHIQMHLPDGRNFMAPSEDELRCKMEYEVVPLIAEYINDGILQVGKDEKARTFAAWLNLQTCSADNADETI